jgi:superfamily II DNA or RNA helicase
MGSVLHAGATVRVRGELWRLARIEPFERCSVLTLEGRDSSNRGSRLRVLTPFERPATIPAPRWRCRGRRAVLTSALAATAAARPAGGLWTAARSAIDLHAYQLAPALSVLAGATRLLLADAVGLGKTIQAGLILAELRERGWVERALIVCPAGLRSGWIAELSLRFGIEAVTFDQDGVADGVASLPPGVNPWTTAATAVASIDFIKRADVLAAASAVPFDLLIVDEAHHLTPATDRGRAIERLARQTPWCVFASATPHSGDQAAFDFLSSLGAHADPITIFHRSRVDAGVAGCRRTHALPVRPGADEAALLAAVDRYAEAIWSTRGRTDPGAQFLAMLLARRAASSVPAIERTLARRLSMLEGQVEPAQARLPWDEDETGAEDPTLPPVAGLDDPLEEKATIAALIAAARTCGPGSKVRRALRIAARVREPVIIFTEFRDTVDAVLSCVPAGLRVACLHGGMAASDRHAVVAAFNTGAFDLLVATDTAGEGLNLHHRCRLVVDLELPWNPLRLEQRVGRVDRLGQRRRVHAVRLFHAGGIEARVLGHLHRRQRRADLEATLPLRTDVELAGAIFDGSPLPPGPAIPGTAVAGTHDEAVRLEHSRAAQMCRLLDDGAWTRPRRQATSVMALRRVASANAHGSLVEERIEAWRVNVSTAARPRQWEQIVASIANQLPEPAPPSRSSHGRVIERIEAIRSELGRRRAKAVQGSLFDRRAEDHALGEERAIRRADAALQRCLAAVGPPSPGAADRVAIAAMWPARTR